MKYSLTLTALILAMGYGGYQLSAAHVVKRRTSLNTLMQKISRAGLNLEAASSGKAEMDKQAIAAHQAATERQRDETKKAEAENVAVEVIAFTLKMEEMKKTKSEPDAEMKMAIFSLLARFSGLDETGLKIAVGHFMASDKLDKETRANLFEFSFTTLSQHNPKAAFALYDETRHHFKDRESKNSMLLPNALRKYASQDLEAALAWLERPENKAFAKNSETKNLLGIEIAKNDLPRALRLLVGEDDDSAVQHLMAASDAAVWNQMIALTRTESSHLPLRDPALKGIGQKLSEGDPAAATQWLAGAQLSGDERRAIIYGVMSTLHYQSPGPWLQWITTQDPDPKKINDLLSVTVAQWTSRDYNAVGEWLNTLPQGALRHSSTAAYAKELSTQEPAAASVWALNLPQNKERTALLAEIVTNWQAKDPTAAAAFAAEHKVTTSK